MCEYIGRILTSHKSLRLWVSWNERYLAIGKGNIIGKKTFLSHRPLTPIGQFTKLVVTSESYARWQLLHVRQPRYHPVPCPDQRTHGFDDGRTILWIIRLE